MNTKKERTPWQGPVALGLLLMLFTAAMNGLTVEMQKAAEASAGVWVLPAVFAVVLLVTLYLIIQGIRQRQRSNRSCAFLAIILWVCLAAMWIEGVQMLITEG